MRPAAGALDAPAGAVHYDALAAARPHPVYPTSACRLGFTDEDLLRYAPGAVVAPERQLTVRPTLSSRRTCSCG